MILSWYHKYYYHINLVKLEKLRSFDSLIFFEMSYHLG
jgi:hypothetical protein